jgi:hypothetical protein
MHRPSLGIWRHGKGLVSTPTAVAFRGWSGHIWCNSRGYVQDHAVRQVMIPATPIMIVLLGSMTEPIVGKLRRADLAGL